MFSGTDFFNLHEKINHKKFNSCCGISQENKDIGPFFFLEKSNTGIALFNMVEKWFTTVKDRFGFAAI